MRENKALGPYLNCQGLFRQDILDTLNYVPETGQLYWKARFGVGGPRIGEPIVNSSFRLQGGYRNTFGIIYLIMLARLPTGRVHFRDRNAKNWRWENIKPLERLDNGEFEVAPLPPYERDETPTRRKPNARARRLQSKT